jgi:hypothetical protein
MPKEVKLSLIVAGIAFVVIFLYDGGLIPGTAPHG